MIYQSTQSQDEGVALNMNEDNIYEANDQKEQSLKDLQSKLDLSKHLMDDAKKAQLHD